MFAKCDFNVGNAMMDGSLYLVRDGVDSPVPLAPLVQLRHAPNSAEYTTYFYSRTEGSSVHLISYQYGSQTELEDDVEGYRLEFGSLSLL